MTEGGSGPARPERLNARVIGAVFVGGFAALLVLPALHYAGLSMDEGLLLVYPELVLRGAVPNRDFLASWGPGDFWLLASLFAVTGPAVLVERIVGIVFHVALAVGVFAHASRWGPSVGLVAGVISGVVLVPLGAAAFAYVGAIALIVSSLVVLSYAVGRPQAASAGALAGLAIAFRPELAPATFLAVLPLAVGLDSGRRAALVSGAALALVPLGVHVIVAGPALVFDNLVLGVFKWGPGRYLPLPGREPAMLALLVLADVTLLAAAGVTLRRDRSPRARALAGFAILSLLTLAQALQRADLFHLASAGAVPLGLLPVSIAVLLGTSGFAGSLITRSATAIGATLALAIGAPVLLIRAAGTELPRAVGFERADTFAVEHDGRTWYPLAASADYTATPVGSAASASELQDTVDDVARIAPPGSRLFVGPLDLRRTNVTDTVIYHLLPGLRPATYYLEMAPGSTNRPDSHLAADIATADVLVLTTRYDAWDEPNAMRDFGSDLPNRVVRDQFELRARHGTYTIYVRRVSSRASAREGSRDR